MVNTNKYNATVCASVDNFRLQTALFLDFRLHTAQFTRKVTTEIDVREGHCSVSHDLPARIQKEVWAGDSKVTKQEAKASKRQGRDDRDSGQSQEGVDPCV